MACANFSILIFDAAAAPEFADEICWPCIVFRSLGARELHQEVSMKFLILALAVREFIADCCLSLKKEIITLYLYTLSSLSRHINYINTRLYNYPRSVESVNEPRKRAPRNILSLSRVLISIPKENSITPSPCFSLPQRESTRECG